MMECHVQRMVRLRNPLFGFTGDYILNHLIGDLRWGLNMFSIDEDTNKWM